jgi:GNAT superfamily N-acetyltransferase
MLYAFQKHNRPQPLAVLPGLEIRQTADPVLMSVIGEIPLEKALERFADGHKAFVAWLHGEPAAFGWMATGKATIGELNHDFVLPPGHRYLWNFRTLPPFRGRGIYPHLLQYMVAAERDGIDCFWIMHAPENQASRRGIRKAGFDFMGQVSVVNQHEVIFDSAYPEVDPDEVLHALGFQRSEAAQATCWSCSSPYLAGKKTGCCCSATEQECNQHLFQTV